MSLTISFSGHLGLENNDILMLGGVYRIRNLVTGDFYIGSTRQFRRRFRQHRRELGLEVSTNLILQRAWCKYGSESFVFEPLLASTNPQQYEQAYLDWFVVGVGLPYNILESADYGHALRGKPKSPEHRAKIAASHLGKKKNQPKRGPMPEQHRENIRQANLRSGYVHPEDFRLKQSMLMKARWAKARADGKAWLYDGMDNSGGRKKSVAK